jgi:hypothetical protein
MHAHTLYCDYYSVTSHTSLSTGLCMAIQEEGEVRVGGGTESEV